MYITGTKKEKPRSSNAIREKKKNNCKIASGAKRCTHRVDSLEIYTRLIRETKGDDKLLQSNCEEANFGKSHLVGKLYNS